MLLLAFDTATPAVTAAVCHAPGDGGPDTVRTVAASSSVDARRHGELLAPAIRDVVAEAGARLGDIARIAVGVGPGPYTGLRVGLATALSLADALGVPCHGIPTLDAIAYASGRTGPFIAASDARRKEVFWARYADASTRTGEIAVDRPAEVDTGGLPVIGHGAAMYPDALGGGGADAAGDPSAFEPLHPSASALGELALRRLLAGEELDAPRPLYLRRPDAVEPSGPKRVGQWKA
ncbi:tRNA (adenosine(37)-N6)-threonylcarbamoyltransferase complex dimerization subunit type 1 TsaB [Nocardiopsis sp. RSe5-2]|uniref:tRNA (Adenosine(37)-N6)-threonylcarbamoyltransferase complex dimerization subunit type 1 TsaB n=1 Tax=Nocardiopsis endophytica TaxID=3018445 RepID=A0ABT4U6A2_9ACTN|nr:tRNA (adenosine(37)-N6)-threonylcarbamoyltransferase complex dimerization subunit type 1 TsaB [Nocardiopsis endophytica]MDA2812468.1 tRNA (adenosine(37)-N6)-threonylcarbamoyltransferase complex dimerization subunit type 1 TsaB [Nocardiopsis endophytica]